MVIDFHTHIFPEKIADRALRSMEGTSGLTTQAAGTLAALKASMAAGGIDRSVTCPIATKPSQTESINRFAIGQLAEPGIVPLGSVHPQGEHIPDTLQALRDAGIRGIKIHPDYQGMPIESKEYIEILQCCRALGLFCVTHAGWDASFPERPMCTPRGVRKIWDDIRGVTLIAAHMGGWKLWDEVEENLRGTDVLIDTSFSFDYLGAPAMREMILRFGPERVLFGTDSPWDGQGKARQDFLSLALPDDVTEQVFSGNALRVLGERV